MNVDELLMKFNAGAREYDRQRRMLIPDFDNFYGTAVRLAETVGTPAILDIGAGTGLLSELMLTRYPDAKLTLVDISDEMMNLARDRFKEHSATEFHVMDYSTGFPEGDFDLIVSSLSIHHLSDPDKRTLMERVYRALKPGGRFINADQVLGPSSFLEEMYFVDWLTRIQATDLSREDIENSLERRKLDLSAPLLDQLAWLSRAGFQQVDCVYKNYFLAVFLGIKE